MSERDDEIRQRIFRVLDERLQFGNGTLTSKELSSFNVEGTPTRLIANSKGIWNPQGLDATLSIVSSADGPYRDEEISPGVWRYDYQARSEEGDNTKLRRAFETRSPLILFRRVSAGVYVPIYPVYVIGDDRANHFFTIAVQEVLMLRSPEDADSRAYVERAVQERVHQREFRSRVLLAYEDSCAVCRLQYPELLDAAHILSDSHERGLPVVSNGLSLCKIHHTAYDRDFMGIDSSYRVHINQELLLRRDGPMLKHGLQEMHGSTITVPRDRRLKPNRESLDERFEVFLRAS